MPGPKCASENIFAVRRLTVPVPGVRTFRASYEQLVPALPVDRVEQLLASKAPWSAMVDLVRAAAPYGFLIYFTSEVHKVMAAAGDNSDCVGYLMGNHVIAETMFRHDPRAMLYAPLRTLIWEDSAGDAWFTVDQPSTQLGSLGNTEVKEVGIQLDRKLALLLEALDVSVPEPLVSGSAASGPESSVRRVQVALRTCPIRSRVDCCGSGRVQGAMTATNLGSP